MHDGGMKSGSQRCLPQTLSRGVVVVVPQQVSLRVLVLLIMSLELGRGVEERSKYASVPVGKSHRATVYESSCQDIAAIQDGHIWTLCANAPSGLAATTSRHSQNVGS